MWHQLRRELAEETSAKPLPKRLPSLEPHTKTAEQLFFTMSRVDRLKRCKEYCYDINMGNQRLGSR